MKTCVPLVDTRHKLASHVAYAARQLWRRKDLEHADNIVLDLLCEALQRMGHMYRPDEGAPAQKALDHAPSYIKDLVKTLERVATPEETPAPIEGFRYRP